ncbi:MAG: NAD-glutamate dehydrogenase [Spongiibacteraceae bacterium]|jgi:glutamate dehydrogenase|nr:NAD-glutamate dehydrogenase [Spongiibacteraceae bacterium]
MKSNLSKLHTYIRKSVAAREEQQQLIRIADRYWDVIDQHELKRRSGAELFDITRHHLELANTRRGNSVKLNIHEDEERGTVLFEMVTADRPFIFDSLSNLLYESGYNLLQSNHPILWVKRDGRGRLQSITALDRKEQETTDYQAESFVRYELEPTINALPVNQLKKRVHETLANIEVVVEDWKAMRAKAAALREHYQSSPAPLKPRARRQVTNFLGWIAENNLTFIGYVKLNLTEKDGKRSLQVAPHTRLGLKLESAPWEHISDPAERQTTLENYLDSRRVLTITKSTDVSPVRRFVPMDYIAIKDFDEDGKLTGEHRFFGLMTRAAYNSRALDIPLLADRIRAVMDMAHFPAGSHNAKMLLQILETFPRDELFQSSTKGLYKISMGVLAIEEHNRVRVFSRADPFHRYYSILVYIPRENYSQQVRERIQKVVGTALNASSCEFNIFFTDSRMARLQLIARLQPDSPLRVDSESLEALVAGITESWQGRLKDLIYERYDRKQGQAIYRYYVDGFSAAYTAKTSPEKALSDIEHLEKLHSAEEPISVRLYRDISRLENRVELRCYFKTQPLPLSDIQPRLNNLGLRLLLEDLYPVAAADGTCYWVQDFRAQVAVDVNQLFWSDSSNFERAFVAIHQGICDDDEFNRLLVSADVNWREAALLRAYCRYLKQLGSNFEQQYLSRLLVEHGSLARLLIDLFHARFSPDINDRETRCKKIEEQLQFGLEGVQSLDADRLIRSIKHLILATLRSNYYLDDQQAVYALKFSPRDIPEAPAPRPRYEIWVHAPWVEAVHLRGDKVARGGLRWSDRPEDFRTEVLGLVKSQMVKNSVIVPVGAKGGFVCRALPTQADRQAIQDEVINCYKTFIRAMLSITDNLVKNRITRPDRLICHDDDDPYLVVAADKGTATFSDIANSISEEFNFWIGDAFASGGSNGYDHKKMGITAKGAWEAVKRHFREMGKDIQREDFSVLGIGDMAGDVFGNGMLLSKHICLKAAFNHQHIFIDPNPNPATTWKERQRLFKLPRSNWEDYDKRLLSKGGALYSRKDKRISPSTEACEALGLETGDYTPDELIHALLKAPVDLLWNGGIGTYVKAEHETPQQVGDRANDAIRVNGSELRCAVIGEGGNLGLTQAGRIEFCRHGGRCNSDFIDNSAGVDSSDNEVNIKILLNQMVAEGELKQADRNRLLRQMTSAVEHNVLRNNYLQTQAISMLSIQAPERLGEQAELIRILERDAGLDRKLENLPDEKSLQARRTTGEGLTRPELACLMSYAKIHINKLLIESSVPEDPYLAQELVRYFPAKLVERFEKQIPKHRLWREIICTVVTNSLVNRMGNAFAHRLNDELGNSFEDMARAYTVARDLFGLRDLWKELETLDNKIDAGLQLKMMLEIRRLIKHVTLWLLNSKLPLTDIRSLIDRYQPEVRMLSENIDRYLSQGELTLLNDKLQHYQSEGVPDALARRVVTLKALYAAPDITWLKEQTRADAELAATLYFQLADTLEITWVRRQIEQLEADTRWHALARNALRDDLYQRHRDLCAKVAGEIKRKADPIKEIQAWVQQQSVQTDYLRDLIAEVRSTQQADYMSLSVILRQLGRLAA